MLAGLRLPRDEPIAIEAKQAGFGTNPEVTVGGLRNGVDAALEKAFADHPGFVRVLIDVERWVQRPSWRAASQKHYQSDSGPPLHAPNYLAPGAPMSPVSGIEYP
jgi:hypothetical protein